MSKHSSLLQFACAALGCLSACGGLAGNVGNGSGGATAVVPQVDHVAIVVLENANYGDVIGTPNMPYLQGLWKSGSLAASYYANSHPSIPNYFMLTTGQPLTNDDGFTGTVTTDNVVRELTAAGKTWKAYTESLPSKGYVGGDQFPYLKRHNPLSFFSDVQQSPSQSSNIVDLKEFATDVSSGSLPNYSFIVPNAFHDAHSCGSLGADCTMSSRLSVADQWLQTNITPLLANTAFQQSGLLIVVFDESADDITNGGGHVVALLAGTHVQSGYVGTKNYDHRSMMSLTMKALGVANIPNGADAAPQMTEFFK